VSGHPRPRSARCALVAAALVAALPTFLRAQAAPPYVRAAEEARVPSTAPTASPAEWMLAIVDVETTGLVPGYDEMIDLGLVMTDLDGRVVDSLFLRVMPAHPERISEGARRVNGFDAARWRRLHALAPTAAVDSLVAFHRRVAGKRPVLLVAFNSQFDAAFLDHLFRSRGSSWRTLYHYFVLDIPSMAWALGYRDLANGALARRLGVADEPRVADEHTGITGAMLNVRIYQALRARGMTPVIDSGTVVAPR
jgi:DNA polymerase III alpha subunit (gram-positive type)